MYTGGKVKLGCNPYPSGIVAVAVSSVQGSEVGGVVVSGS